MRIVHGNRRGKRFFVVSFLLCFGAGTGYAMPRVARTGQASTSKTTAKAASAKSGKKTPAKSSTKSSAKKSPAKHTRTQMAPTSARISEIQSALATQGTYQGATTGKWDDATVEAMKRFQSANGLNPSGKLDALSLQKLGMGSSVAGRGAPLPSANPQASAIGETAHELQ